MAYLSFKEINRVSTMPARYGCNSDYSVQKRIWRHGEQIKKGGEGWVREWSKAFVSILMSNFQQLHFFIYRFSEIK